MILGFWGIDNKIRRIRNLPEIEYFSVKKRNQVQGEPVSVGTISTSRQVEHAFVTRDTKDRYAGGALRNEEMGQTIQLSVGGQRKRNGRMHSMHRSRIVFKKLVLDRSQTEFKEMHVLAFQCPWNVSKDLSTKNLMHVDA